MSPEPEFVDQVADAYAHLYDLVHLRTHPLVDRLLTASPVSVKQKAWQLHHLLLESIAQLEPEPQVPILSRQWRRHRLMVLRYVKALDRSAVMEELGISRRHYYREHRIAIKGLAAILWDRFVAQPSPVLTVPEATADQSDLSHLELLRLEVARLSQADRFARLHTVVQGALPLLQRMLEQQAITVRSELCEELSPVSIDANLLRQMILGLLAYLVERSWGATLRLSTQATPSAVRLTLRVEPPATAGPRCAEDNPGPLVSLVEIAELCGARIRECSLGTATAGFEVDLPTARRTVLVVDDNGDVLELFRRYLSPHGYQIVTAQTAEEAVSLAQRLRPFATTLDLMMPKQDGWDLLQLLLNRPDTRHIPVIVCSVLKQRQLALSLGAAAFLEKPITEEALVSALEALGQYDLSSAGHAVAS